MWIWTTIGLVILVVLMFLMVEIPHLYTYRKLSKIHGPKGWPFIGVGLDLYSLNYSEVFPYIKKNLEEFPEVMKAWILGIPLVFITNPEIIETVMSSVNHINKGIEYKFFTSWLNEGLLISKGQKWKLRRKLLTPSFHFKILENNLGTMNKNSRFLVKNFLEINEPIDVHSLISSCTLDIICETAMDTTVNAQDKQGQEYTKSIKSVSETILFRMLNLYIKDSIFNLLPIGISFKKNIKQLQNYTEKIIQERKQIYKKKEINEESTGKKRHAFLDMLIELESNNSSIQNNLDIREEVDTFMFEGHDTTSSALTFAMFLLGLHQDIQEKAYQEQYDIFGDSDREVLNSDLTEMIYLTKIIKETLRLFPSVPYMSRRLTHDVKTTNVLIPKGSNVVILPYFIHRNEKYFPNPEIFDPERFDTDQSIKNRHPFSYIPFSAGPRNCIGQKFAMMELKVVLSTIIRYCKLESVTKYEELELIPLVILRNKSPILINVRSRF